MVEALELFLDEVNEKLLLDIENAGEEMSRFALTQWSLQVSLPGSSGVFALRGNAKLPVKMQGLSDSLRSFTLPFKTSDALFSFLMCVLIYCTHTWFWLAF